MLGYGESFDYNGHTYTALDSARIQSECPHCGKRSNINGCIHPIKDKNEFKFLGFAQTSCGDNAICYECLSCYEKFWFHLTGFLKHHWEEEIKESMIDAGE